MVFYPQSKALKNCIYLYEYNDDVCSTDAKQAATKFIATTIAIARMHYIEENNLHYNIRHLSSMDIFKQFWPNMCEFTIFNAMPKIDDFMAKQYNWLESWPHSLRYINEVVLCEYISYHIFEICYGPARISYPVVQATFSIYFVFGVNKLVDPNSECAVRYFLEGSDERLIPCNNDKITKSQIKSLLKKKLGLSSLIMLGSQPAPKLSAEFKRDFKKFIQNKKCMLQEITIHNNVISPEEISLFPCDFYVKTKRNCLFHEYVCPIIYDRRRASLELPHDKYTYENFMRSGWKPGEEKFVAEELSSYTESSLFSSCSEESSKESTMSEGPSVDTHVTPENKELSHDISFSLSEMDWYGDGMPPSYLDINQPSLQENQQ